MTDQVDLAGFISAMSGRTNKDTIHTSIIGEIVSYDAETRRASVQPLIRQSDERGVIQYPVLQDVKVQFPSGGGYSVTWKPKAGDTGMIVFQEKSIAEWIDNGGLVTAKSGRHHHLSDAFFIAGVWSDKETGHTHDGDGILIANDSDSKHILLSASGTEIKGNMDINGELNVTGDITATGGISTATGDISAGAITLKTHTHPTAPTGAMSLPQAFVPPTP